MCSSFLTHSESGNHVGTRLHMSLMIRITTTAELRLLTLAWRHKQKPVKLEEVPPLSPHHRAFWVSPKTIPNTEQAQKGQSNWAISKSTSVKTNVLDIAY